MCSYLNWKEQSKSPLRALYEPSTSPLTPYSAVLHSAGDTIITICRVDLQGYYGPSYTRADRDQALVDVFHVL